jgi:dihydrofolate reductase
MEICHIVAVDKNNCIGKGNDLPWHIPKDLQYFKERTLGCPVIMGRKTFESIGRPLPKRLNIVVTRNKDYKAPEGVLVLQDLEQAIEKAKEESATGKIFIIGGGEIFKKTLPTVDTVFITRVDLEVEDGEAFYPHLGEEFKLVESQKDFDTVNLTFETYRAV